MNPPASAISADGVATGRRPKRGADRGAVGQLDRDRIYPVPGAQRVQRGRRPVQGDHRQVPAAQLGDHRVAERSAAPVTSTALSMVPLRAVLTSGPVTPPQRGASGGSIMISVVPP